jgi:hypothetical protein
MKYRAIFTIMLFSLIASSIFAADSQSSQFRSILKKLAGKSTSQFIIEGSVADGSTTRLVLDSGFHHQKGPNGQLEEYLKILTFPSNKNIKGTTITLSAQNSGLMGEGMEVNSQDGTKTHMWKFGTSVFFRYGNLPREITIKATFKNENLVAIELIENGPVPVVNSLGGHDGDVVQSETSTKVFVKRLE